jgi:uncharacterized protein
MKKNNVHEKFAVKRGSAGFGLFSKASFQRGDFIIEYAGPIVSNKQADERGGKYLFEISSRRTIDGSARSNLARYINHSCRPNCEAEIDGSRVMIYAKRNIAAGEEFTYHYGKEYFKDLIKPFGCRCSMCFV